MAKPQQKPRDLLRLPEVMQLVKLASRTIYERMDRGDFPQRYYLNGRGGPVGWDRSELINYLNQKVPVPVGKRKKQQAKREVRDE